MFGCLEVPEVFRDAWCLNGKYLEFAGKHVSCHAFGVLKYGVSILATNMSRLRRLMRASSFFNHTLRLYCALGVTTRKAIFLLLNALQRHYKLAVERLTALGEGFVFFLSIPCVFTWRLCGFA